jgi:hypothetical protein
MKIDNIKEEFTHDMEKRMKQKCKTKWKTIPED